VEQFFKLFQAIVSSKPDALAVADDMNELSYERFDIVTDQFARHIYETRQSLNDVIAYLGAHSVDRIVSLIARLKAGAAVVRLDPARTEDLLKQTIETCGVTRIIAAPECFELARGLAVGEPLSVPEVIGERSDVEPCLISPSSPEALAAAVYGSACGAVPTLVPLTYGSLDTRLSRKYNVSQPPGALPQRSVNFLHLGLIQVLVALQNGDLFDYFDIDNLGLLAFADWAKQRSITQITCQVPIFRRLMALSDQKMPSVRRVFLVGSTLSEDDIHEFERHFSPGSSLYGMFTGAEWGDVAVYKHDHGAPIIENRAPLGSILFPGNFRLLNSEGREVGEGEPGEIVVSGDYIGHGYLRDPDRSTGVFAAETDGSGHWRCNTGYLTQKDVRGILHAVGLKDEQVCIRGYFVRPLDIEASVKEHPGIGQVAIVPFKGANQKQRLACFYTFKDGFCPSPEELSSSLIERAPSYLVPSAFIQRDHLLIAANGTVLKQELPDPLALVQELRGTDQSSWSAEERSVAQLWENILGHADFALDEDFFDVGADSLQAMALVLAMEAKFGRRLPMEGLILNGASVRLLAERLVRLAGKSLDRTPVVMRKGGRRAPVFVPHVAGGHLSDYLELAHAVDVEQPFIGLRTVGLDRTTPPRAKMEEIAADAIAAMRLYTPNGPYRLMGYSFGGLIAFEMARILMEEGEAVSHLIVIDPSVLWMDPSRHLKSVYRALKVDGVGAAWRRLTRTLPAVFNLLPPPTGITVQHCYGIVPSP
jgi:acyl-CoA synthetase (AMP-forming)/AMP-acid ligase II/acyl carrier protein